MIRQYLPSLRIILIIIIVFPFLLTEAQNKPYRGAEVYAKSAVKYGRIEVRMMAARGSGILSTFFTWKEGSEQSSVFWEEIDVEVFGKDNATKWQSNIITGFDPTRLSEEVHTSPTSLADDFHTYAVEWTPAYVAWFIDGVEVRKTIGQQAPSVQSPAGIRFNLWASNSISWAGEWDEIVLPQYQFVNWIRYYRYENFQFVLDWVDDFDLFNTTRWDKASWTYEANRADFDPNNALVQEGMLILCLTMKNETGFNGTVPVDTNTTTSLNEKNNLPIRYTLAQNYPNPFNPTTIITYQLPVQSKVSLKVYDIFGREIKTLVNNETRLIGSYQVTFDASEIPSGVYFYRFISDLFQETKKMLLVK